MSPGLFVVSANLVIDVLYAGRLVKDADSLHIIDSSIVSGLPCKFIVPIIEDISEIALSAFARFDIKFFPLPSEPVFYFAVYVRR